MPLLKRKPAIRFGDLTTFITIEQPTYTEDATGDEVISWSTYRTTYAKKVWSSGSEQFQGDRDTEIIRYKYKIDFWDSGIDAKMRIDDDGDKYYITARERVGANKGTIIYAEVRDVS